MLFLKNAEKCIKIVNYIQNANNTLFFKINDDRVTMDKKKKAPKKNKRCAYVYSCYLAEDLECFGYKSDCVLYKQSNGQYFGEKEFNETMDKLINKTRIKHSKVK
ncbi:MAG: hypothetical protein U9N54_01535 [candidate division Zixibacteria bacterium]|nr:hypothetical protein [candidate division Zixibacteria bacterium]